MCTPLAVVFCVKTGEGGKDRTTFAKYVNETEVTKKAM